MKRLATFDLIFFNDSRRVWPELRDSLLVTLQLNLFVVFLTYAIAIPTGVFSAAYPNSNSDRALTLGLFILYSLPSFWVADLLRLWFQDREGFIWFPVLGLHGDDYARMGTWARFTDYLHHIALPVFCMTYGCWRI